MVDKPQYHQQPYASPAKLPVNGADIAPDESAPLKITSITEPAEDTADLVEYVAKACTEAASKVAAEQVERFRSEVGAQLALWRKKEDDYTAVIKCYTTETEALVQKRAEILVACATAEKDMAATRNVLEVQNHDLERREANLQAIVANQTVGIRILVLTALVTACGLWGFTIFSPELQRTVAATIFSLVTVGPLVALLWKRG
jgi:hypothetical protein